MQHQTKGYIISIVLMAMCLSACATYTSSIFTTNESKTQAAQDYVNLSLAYIQSNNFLQAHKYINRALNINDNLALAYDALGLLYQAENKPVLAHKNFLQALEHNNKLPQIHNNYAIFLASQGNYQQAIEHFKIAIQDTSYQKLALAHYNYAQVAVKINNLSLAEQQITQAIFLDNNQAVFRLSFSLILTKQNKHLEAQKQLQYYQDIILADKQELDGDIIWLASYLAKQTKNKNKIKYYDNLLRTKYPTLDAKEAYTRYILN